MPVSPLILQDSLGNLWTVSADSSGQLLTTKGAVGPPVPPTYLNDPLGITSWLIGIDTLGRLTSTKQSLLLLYPYLIPLTSSWSLTVDPIGRLQTRPALTAAPAYYPILRNCRMYAPERFQNRPGMKLITSGFVDEVHSCRRLNDPIAGSFARILGAGTNLFRASSPTPIDTGYSGDPLALVPFRPAQSPRAWMYVGDANKMRKVLSDGTNYQMGIAPPLNAPVVNFGPPAVNEIDDFNSIGSWVPSGTAGALSAVPRTLPMFATAIVYDTYGYDEFGSVAPATGWAEVPISPINLMAVREGTRLKVAQTGGGSPTETIIVQEVIPAAFNNSAAPTIADISYDSGSTGLCTITLNVPLAVTRANRGYAPSMDLPTAQGSGVSRAASNNPIGIRNNALIQFFPSEEWTRVVSVSENPDGTFSFRCATGFTHAAGEIVQTLPAIRAHFANAYNPYAHTVAFSASALQSTIAPGIGLISEVTPLNLGIFGNVQLPIQEDDIIHISLQIDNAASLVEFRLVFDIDPTTTDFQHTYFFKSWSASDIQQALQGNTTVQQSRQSSYSSEVINRNIGTLPGARPTGPAIILHPTVANDPAQVALQSGSNFPTASKLTPAGLGAWAELTCKVSDLTKVGSYASATLASVRGVRIYINVSQQAVCAVSALYLTGAYGPDIGDTGVPYLYRYQPRSSFTGARGYPSPPTRSGIEPHRQSIEVDMTQHPDPQVDLLDIFRWGGTLAQWTYVGTAPNSSGPFFVDELSDTAIQSAPLLSFDNLQPFPTIDTPKSGIVNVVGSTVKLTGGDPFNTRWAQGTQININGIFYTFYAQPSSSSRVEIVENGGTQTGVPYHISQATLLGQPLPALWGPYSQGTALYLFACGDIYQPGVLFLTNGNDPDSASDVYQIEITTPSEPLMNGLLYNGQSYVWSSDRMFFLYPSFGSGVVIESGSLLPSAGTNLFVPLEVPNGKGLFARFALTVGPKMWFRARDGIYETTGGEPRNITTGELALLFPHDGQPGVPVSIGTFVIYPPDDTQPQYQRMSYYDSHIYFTYMDTNGTLTTLVANTSFNPYVWAKDDYSPEVLFHYGEEGEGVHALLEGSVDGSLWQAAGAADGDDLNVMFEARMPQMSELVGGFQHVRDGYLGLIESNVASLVINVDGADNMVSLPSVSGAYSRIYTPLPALKGRLFAFALIGQAPFALFRRDCQIACRTWGDDGAFQPINPFSSLTRAVQGKVA